GIPRPPPVYQGFFGKSPPFRALVRVLRHHFRKGAAPLPRRAHPPPGVLRDGPPHDRVHRAAGWRGNGPAVRIWGPPPRARPREGHGAGVLPVYGTVV